MAVICFVSTIVVILVGLLIKALIDDHRECRREEKIDLYRRAELIGKRRLDHEPL